MPFNVNCNSTETKLVYNCSLFHDSEPWCSVHTYPNGSQVQGHYGYCKEDCQSQIPSKSRPEHLANPLFNKLWSTKIYNIHAWKAGLCHTYSPNETFFPGSEGQLYAFIGDGIRVPRHFLHGYEIYLHSQKVIYQILFHHNKAGHVEKF